MSRTVVIRVREEELVSLNAFLGKLGYPTLSNFLEDLARRCTTYG